MGRLGRFLGPLEAFLWRLDRLLVRLGASRIQFRQIWGTPAVENHGNGKIRFSKTFAFFPFMCVKTHFCTILDGLGAYLGHRGALLRRTGGLLRPFWGAYGLPRASWSVSFGAPCGVLEHLEASWGSRGALFGGSGWILSLFE